MKPPTASIETDDDTIEVIESAKQEGNVVHPPLIEGYGKTMVANRFSVRMTLRKSRRTQHRLPYRPHRLTVSETSYGFAKHANESHVGGRCSSGVAGCHRDGQ